MPQFPQNGIISFRGSRASKRGNKVKAPSVVSTRPLFHFGAFSQLLRNVGILFFLCAWSSQSSGKLSNLPNKAQLAGCSSKTRAAIFLFVWCFWDGILLCSSGWPWSHPPAWTSKCWDYMCATTPIMFFLRDAFVKGRYRMHSSLAWAAEMRGGRGFLREMANFLFLSGFMGNRDGCFLRESTQNILWFTVMSVLPGGPHPIGTGTPVETTAPNFVLCSCCTPACHLTGTSGGCPQNVTNMETPWNLRIVVVNGVGVLVKILIWSLEFWVLNLFSYYEKVFSDLGLGPRSLISIQGRGLAPAGL